MFVECVHLPLGSPSILLGAIYRTVRSLFQNYFVFCFCFSMHTRFRFFCMCHLAKNKKVS
jgi:hypothetical protein